MSDTPDRPRCELTYRDSGCAVAEVWAPAEHHAELKRLWAEGYDDPAANAQFMELQARVCAEVGE